MKFILLHFTLLFFVVFKAYKNPLLLAQIPDSAEKATKVTELAPISIEDNNNKPSITRLKPIVGTYIYAGKKNEVIELTQLDANITEKIARQIFSKVPGVFVYDLEGSNQLNISTRGLDPHRGWEYNVRKDGIITNSDMYAYPASHFSPPMESIERLELIRGTAALQYGAQFGGMLNYITKQGDTTKLISFENFSTVGSFNLLSTYNAIGGKIGKIKYYSYYAKRYRKGYRKNEQTDYEAQGIILTYQLLPNLSLRAEWSHSVYIYRIPGPLNDAMFQRDPTQATRLRNYYSPDIHVPSFMAYWSLTPKINLQYQASAVIGQRRSVIFDRPATIRDTIQASTLQYTPRQVDIDDYNSFTQELRGIGHYSILGINGSLLLGLQWMHNHMLRRQLGKGTPGFDFDLTLIDPAWGRDMRFKTHNIAFFAENSWQLHKNFRINLGIRLENGESRMGGKIIYYPENQIPVTMPHKFPLLGASFSYMPFNDVELYGGIAQNYRPTLFKDIVPASIYEKVNPELKDGRGFNAEIGCRGRLEFLEWDITLFWLQYNNRFGTLAITEPNGNFYIYRTNVGNSATKGIEIFLQTQGQLTTKTLFFLFTATSIMDGRYTEGQLRSGNVNVDLKGKKIESVPEIITRNGLTVQHKKLRFTLLQSYTAASFADPLNTPEPNPTGSIGLVPAYLLWDCNVSWQVSKNFEFRAGLHNITNKQYFTKRPTFYPGPGIWPSDGRNWNMSLIIRL
ncbi:MAG: TonB-dependent receptor [Bacteroidia bacterium]|nr:TonB-dependent receptor [Bacteroidia bacterium]MDW8157996.1 TonB-dependent receptor [Bacteroidia bacterium]